MRFADDVILPMKYKNYVHELHSYILAIISGLKNSNAPESISCTPLLSALEDLEASIWKFTLELEVLLHFYALEWISSYVK